MTDAGGYKPQDLFSILVSKSSKVLYVVSTPKMIIDDSESGIPAFETHAFALSGVWYALV